MKTQIATSEPTMGFVIPRDWAAKEAERTFSTNELISAYLVGKEHAMDHALEKARQQLNSNIRTATVIAEDLLRTLEEKAIKLVGIHLKPVNIRNFEFLFIVDEQSFDSEEFINAYSITHQVKNQYQTDDLVLEFSYLSNEETLSDECLVADGYFIHYNHEQGAKA